MFSGKVSTVLVFPRWCTRHELIFFVFLKACAHVSPKACVLKSLCFGRLAKGVHWKSMHFLCISLRGCLKSSIFKCFQGVLEKRCFLSIYTRVYWTSPQKWHTFHVAERNSQFRIRRVFRIGSNRMSWVMVGRRIAVVHAARSFCVFCTAQFFKECNNISKVR